MVEYAPFMASPIVQIVDVTKSYGEGKVSQAVLRGVSLELFPGEMVALVGQSGSGKSTLLHIAGGLDRPDTGQVIVDGQALERMDDRSLSRLRNERIGFVFQSFHLLDHLSVAENVARGIMDVQVRAGIPFAFEVLYVSSLKQAQERARGDVNKGAEAARAVLHSLAELKRIRS